MSAAISSSVANAMSPAVEPVRLAPTPAAAPVRPAEAPVRDLRPQQEAKPASSREAQDEQVSEAVDQVNRVMETFGKGIHFRIHEGTGQSYVQIINRDTETVLREIPSKEMLDMVARFHEVIGVLFDAKG